MPDVVERNYGISFAALIPIIVLSVFVEQCTSGSSTWEACLPGICYCIGAAIIFVLLGLSKTTFSEQGIYRQFLWFKKHRAWDQVIQAGIIVLDTDQSVAQFAFTFTGGSPRKRGETRKYWMRRNGSNCIGAKYNRDLHTLVLKCYGPLDFDLWNNPSEQSTVVD